MGTDIERHEAWAFMPLRHADLSLSSEVYSGLQRSGQILSPADSESKARTMKTVWNMSNSKLARQPRWHLERDGKRYLTEMRLDGVHIDPEKLDMLRLDRGENFPLHPDVLRNQMDFVDVLRTAVDNQQTMQDMYKSSEERRHRRRARA